MSKTCFRHKLRQISTEIAHCTSCTSTLPHSVYIRYAAISRIAVALGYPIFAGCFFMWPCLFCGWVFSQIFSVFFVVYFQVLVWLGIFQLFGVTDIGRCLFRFFIAFGLFSPPPKTHLFLLTLSIHSSFAQWVSFFWVLSDTAVSSQFPGVTLSATDSCRGMHVLPQCQIQRKAQCIPIRFAVTSMWEYKYIKTAVQNQLISAPQTFPVFHTSQCDISASNIAQVPLHNAKRSFDTMKTKDLIHTGSNTQHAMQRNGSCSILTLVASCVA